MGLWGHIDIRRRVVLACALAAALMPAFAPAPARATFAAPVNLSAAGGSAYNPQVAIDADGDALIVWHRYDGTHYRIQARSRSAAGKFGRVVTLSPAGQSSYDPRVAIDADGDALVVWYSDEMNNVQARFRSASGYYGRVLTLSPAGEDARHPLVTMNAGGNALIVWRKYDGTNHQIKARSRAASGKLGLVQTFSAAGQNAKDPWVAMKPNGDALVVWSGSDGTDDRIQTRFRSAGGNLGQVVTLSPAGQDAHHPRVAIAADGEALFVWSRNDGTNGRIQARSGAAAGSFGAVQTLSPAELHAFDPEVAIDADGDALIVWGASDFESGQQLAQVRSRSALGRYGPVQTLSAPGFALDFRVAINANGNALVVWSRSDETNTRIQARSRSIAGSFGPVQTPSAAGRDARHPQVAIDADGDALVVWSRSDGTYMRTQAASGP